MLPWSPAGRWKVERFSSIDVVLVALPTLPCDSSSNLAWYAAFVIFLSENTWSGVSMMRTIVFAERDQWLLCG